MIVKKMFPLKVFEWLGYLAEKSPRLFNFVYLYIDKLQQRRISLQTPDSDPKITQIVKQLQNDGIARWEGFIDDPEFLNNAKQKVEKLIAISKTKLHAENPDKNSVDDSQNDVTYGRADHWIKEYGAFATGRNRAFWDSNTGNPATNPLFAKVVTDDRIKSVLFGYMGTPPSSIGVLSESLEPALFSDDWHIDRYDHQTKAMILLSDVGMDNGPMRYIKGTHKNNTPGKLDLLFRYYSKGMAHAYPSPSWVKTIPAETIYATGKAGDCFFFDTVGIHSGTRCISDKRLCFSIYPEVISFKRKTWDRLRGKRKPRNTQ